MKNELEALLKLTENATQKIYYQRFSSGKKELEDAFYLQKNYI